MLGLLKSVGAQDNITEMLSDPHSRLTIFAFVNSALPTPLGTTIEQLSSSPSLPVQNLPPSKCNLPCWVLAEAFC